MKDYIKQPIERVKAFPVINLLNVKNEIIAIEYRWNTGELQVRWIGQKCPLKYLRRVACIPANSISKDG